MSRVVEELNVLEGSLRKWMRQFPAGELMPVRVEASSRTRQSRSRAAAEAAAALMGTISLTTPAGLRFEGLDACDVAILLEQLQ